jgi:hypothetical protein
MEAHPTHEDTIVFASEAADLDPMALAAALATVRSVTAAAAHRRVTDAEDVAQQELTTA